MNIKNKRKRIYKNRGYYSNLTEEDIRQFMEDLAWKGSASYYQPVLYTGLESMIKLNEHK